MGGTHCSSFYYVLYYYFFSLHRLVLGFQVQFKIVSRTPSPSPTRDSLSLSRSLARPLRSLSIAGGACSDQPRYLSLSVLLCLSFSLWISRSVPLSLSLAFCLCMSLSLSLCISFSLFVCMCAFLYIYVRSGIYLQLYVLWAPKFLGLRVICVISCKNGINLPAWIMIGALFENFP